MPFDPRFIARLIPALIEGAEVTVELAALTFAICLVWGLIVALANGTRGPLSWIAGTYIQVVRNTPLLIQLYIVYFGLSMIGMGCRASPPACWRCASRTAVTWPRSIAAACRP